MEKIQQNEQPDIIDIREIWYILKKRKIIIIFITILLTLSAILYINIVKPVYRGSAMIEIGMVANEQFNDGKYSSLSIIRFDNIHHLKNIVNETTNVTASIPKKTAMLNLIATGTDKSIIKENLENAIKFILKRHKKISKIYSSKDSKLVMTQLIGEIKVNNTPIKPNKKLIVVVAFITGLMLSVFLAFFLEFISGMKKDPED